MKYFEHHFKKFDSGLRLVTIPMTGTRTVTVLVLVGTGSKYETKNINGISHFLEHMMFKGTEKRPGALDIARELDILGAEYNAFTSKEYTGYYAKANSEKLDIIMDVIFDIFLNSKLDAKEIAVEKGVIIEEINMYRDNPSRYVSDLFEQLLYGDQPAGWDVAGEKEIIQKLERDDFVNYFNSHYVAGDTIVAVAGNVKPEEVEEKTARYFANVRQNEKIAKLPVTEKQSEPAALIHWKETDQSHFNLGVRSYHMFDDRKYPLSILSAILGGGMSSRLFQEVREKRGLAYYIGSSSDEYTDTGFFMVRAGVDKNRTMDAIKVVIDELAKARDGGVSAKELQDAKDHVNGGMALFLEHSDNVASAYASPILFENKVLTIEEKLAKINAVTLEDISGVAKDIIKNDSLNLALIGPFKDAEPFKQILKF